MRNKIYLSRIVSLKDFDNVLIGRDLSNALQKGMVYGILNIGGNILLEELGPHATSQKGLETRKLGQIAIDGVSYLTQEEYAAQLEQQDK